MLPSPIKKYPKTFSLSAEAIEGIEEAAKCLGVTRSYFLEHALETYLKHFNLQLERLENSEAQQKTLAA